MKKSEQIVKSLINASGVFVYVFLVAWFLTNAKAIFGESEPKGPFVPVFMLILFIVSASVTSLLVLGKPVHLYFSGLKKEAFVLLFTTLAWLVLFLAAVVMVLLLR